MAAMTEVAPGRVIDGFELGPCVHEGAMGRLFEVARPGASFPMLMKVPRMGLVDSAELMLGFETEAMILPRLHGQHVPRFVAAGSVTTVPYLVTERIAGASLDGRIGAPLPADEVARIGAAIADALHSVHAQDVIHFDIKPDNVLLRPDGRAVLVDFALAHHRHLPDLVSQERRYTAGSAPYISPEQVRGVRTDPRSDLFALGVLLYELATGRLPFGIPATYAGMRDRLWIDPPPPRSATLAVPDWLQEVILRCLETEAVRRYQTAALVAFDLRNPQQVALTERGARRHRAGALAQAARWWRARTLGVLPGGGAKEEPGAAPVVMVAVDTSHPDDPRQPELQRVTRRILSLSPEFRLICVSVVTSGLGLPDPRAADVQVEHRIRLRHWIGPLEVEPDRVSMHVLEAPDPSAALVEFAARNNVDLIVLGAPAPDERTFAWWRSVASAVTANAPCSVHVVRRSGEPAA